MEEGLHAEEKLLHERGVDVDKVGKVLQDAQDRFGGDAGPVQQDLPELGSEAGAGGTDGLHPGVGDMLGEADVKADQAGRHPAQDVQHVVSGHSVQLQDNNTVQPGQRTFYND